MKESYKKNAAISVIIAAVMFIILTSLAMIFFPGGYSIGEDFVYTTGYTFSMNFFSDLGMLVTETGYPNTISAILWFIALNGVGVTFLLYALSLPSYFQKGTNQHRFAILGTIFTVISALGYIGVAWTPWDILLQPHIFFVFLAFPVSIFYGAFFSVAIFMKKTYPNIFGALLIDFCICMGIYLWYLFGGPSISGEQGRMIGAIAQKVIVYIMIVLIPVEAAGSLIVLKRSSQ